MAIREIAAVYCVGSKFPLGRMKVCSRNSSRLNACLLIPGKEQNQEIKIASACTTERGDPGKLSITFLSTAFGRVCCRSVSVAVKVPKKALTVAKGAVEMRFGRFRRGWSGSTTGTC